eukprot:SAG31_NODE_3575_length_4110_cov_2.432560_3_plen_68_part_00
MVAWHADRIGRMARRGGSIEPEGARLGLWSGHNPVRAAVFDAGYLPGLLRIRSIRTRTSRTARMTTP